MSDCDDKLKVAVHHLLWVCYQYGQTKEVEGDVYLIHKDMAAGKDAGEWLQSLGYVECGGYMAKITKKGIELMELDL